MTPFRLQTRRHHLCLLVNVHQHPAFQGRHSHKVVSSLGSDDPNQGTRPQPARRFSLGPTIDHRSYGVLVRPTNEFHDRDVLIRLPFARTNSAGEPFNLSSCSDVTEHSMRSVDFERSALPCRYGRRDKHCHDQYESNTEPQLLASLPKGRFGRAAGITGHPGSRHRLVGFHFDSTPDRFPEPAVL
ncbi:MAG: hypothetical protein CM1200mP2_38050 [Planctomycetaceae bacterium]|nr:MAG: hypothetical protein CM1200mP2_38050 [Planctomycetaceae bacterium]